MAVLTAAVVLVGALCLVDLLLTFGVIRRLRECCGAVQSGAAGAPGAAQLPVVGRRVDEFAATTVDGTPVSPDALAPGTVVVFVAPACKDCRAQLPDLIRWAGTQDRQQILVVVDARTPDRIDDLVDRLNPVARVVVEGLDAPVMTAFGVNTFPAACVVTAGIVVASSPDFSRLPVLR